LKIFDSIPFNRVLKDLFYLTSILLKLIVIHPKELFYRHGGRLGFGPNGMGFPLSSDVRLNFSRYPPGAVNSPVRTLAGYYRETQRRDLKICRNNNVPVDPFAHRHRDGKTAIGTGRVGGECRLGGDLYAAGGRRPSF